MSRRWRYPRARRGEFFEVPRPVAAPQLPALTPKVTRARLRLGVAVRRGRFAVIPRPIAGPAPVVVRQGESRLGVRTRRGTFRGAPSAASFVPAAVVRGSVRVGGPRPGRFFAVPLPAAVVPPPPFPPRVLRRPVRLAAVRHGGFASRPWPSQAPPPPPPWVPPVLSAGRPHPPGRRGRFTTCPATQNFPPLGRVRRPVVVPLRRGQFTLCPASVPVLPRMPRRLLRPPIARRGLLVEPPWPQAAPPPPPAYAPAVLKGRRGVPALRFHGRIMQGWMELTTSPVVEGAAVLFSASGSVVNVTTAFGAIAAFTSSDSPVASIGGDG